MYQLGVSLIAMLIIALLLLLIPFIGKNNASKKGFLAIGTAIIVVAALLYSISGNHVALRAWLNGGKTHYDLLVEYQQLGGMDGMIKRIEAKLKNDPHDAQGWYILGKLYLMKEDYRAAKNALEKAHALKPEDGQIEYFYHRAADAVK